MRNFVQEGDVLTVTAPAAVKSGDPLLIGSIFGVCATDAAMGADVSLACEGVFDLPKAAGALLAGGLAYFDPVAGKITATGAGNFLVGSATIAAAADATVARVRLSEAPVVVAA